MWERERKEKGNMNERYLYIYMCVCRERERERDTDKYILFICRLGSNPRYLVTMGDRDRKQSICAPVIFAVI